MGNIRVCMLLYGDVEHDARVQREARTLVDAGYQVTIATLALADDTRVEVGGVDGATVVPLTDGRRRRLLPGSPSPFLEAAAEGRGPVGRLRRRLEWLAGYARTYRGWAREAERRLPPADIWHGHDLPGLWAAGRLRARHGGAVIYDSHELFLQAGSAARLPRPARSLLAFFEGRSARSAAGVITVNRSIAETLERQYRVHPVVVMNCPPFRPPSEAPQLRRQLGLVGRRVALFHGALSEGRGVEELVEVLPGLDPNTALVLLGDGPLAASLQARSAQPAWQGRLVVHPAVPLDVLRDWVCDADVGLILFQPVDRNNILGTPNKLFEYFEAGVPVVVSNFPEMERIVNETDAGVACDPTDEHAILRAIRAILDAPAETQAHRRAAARRAAAVTYNWQVQSAALVELYAAVAPTTGPLPS